MLNKDIVQALINDKEIKMVSTQILKQLRAQHGWTQEQLATISGVSSRTIQRIEQTGDCSLESKMAIAAAFSN